MNTFHLCEVVAMMCVLGPIKHCLHERMDADELKLLLCSTTKYGTLATVAYCLLSA